MNNKIIDRNSPLWISENKIKDKVYQVFEQERLNAKNNVALHEEYVISGSYEEQAAFMAHGALSSSKQKWYEIESLIGSLYEKPYFSHICATINGSTNENYFLSDNEKLDKLMLIEDDGYLLPFKLDKQRPLIAQIFHCYQAKNGESFTSKSGDIIKPILICDDSILNGILLNVVKVFSDTDDDEQNIDSDELLVLKLQENRENPTLANIISTLQLSQFEIIQNDVFSDFAVQGCAGSGKSQILLHRLFFLRDMLSESNWDKVLLITPSELFRNYSSELVRRYGLSSIKNISIAELYKEFLEAYDSNFKNRQYRFEFTEEYLPDDYLHEIYTENNIHAIDKEIKEAIKNYISEACQLLDEELPDSYNSDFVDKLVDTLETRIAELDMQITKTDSEEENIEDVISKDELLSKIEMNKIALDSLQQQYEFYTEKRKHFNKVYDVYIEIKNERSNWIIQRQTRILNISQKITDCENIKSIGENFGLPGRYAQLLYLFDDVSSGNTFKYDEEYLKFLDEYYEQAYSDVKDIVGEMPFEQYNRILVQTESSMKIELEQKRQELESFTFEYEKYLLEDVEFKTKQKKENQEIKDLRTRYSRARYFLQRLETTVFEKEVWNTLAPIKKRYDIQTVAVDGKNKRIRILYKSDLLFYLRIYAHLHPNTSLPQYNFLCIDEAQDLHAVEYATLRALYPDASFNLYGDTAQVLHKNCGITDWSKETDVKKVYRLNKNYRNTAEIVDFCNKKFGSNMEYIGDFEFDAYPQQISDINVISELLSNKEITVIVKNKKMFSQFCREIKVAESSFDFLDTNAVTTTNKKRKCYTIYAAKGLEFSKVIVYSKEMTPNQQVVACTRAMETLYYYE